MPLERENPDYHAVVSELCMTEMSQRERNILLRMNEIAFFKVVTEEDKEELSKMIKHLQELTEEAPKIQGMESWYDQGPW